MKEFSWRRRSFQEVGTGFATGKQCGRACAFGEWIKKGYSKEMHRVSNHHYENYSNWLKAVGQTGLPKKTKITVVWMVAYGSFILSLLLKLIYIMSMSMWMWLCMYWGRVVSWPHSTDWKPLSSRQATARGQIPKGWVYPWVSCWGSLSICCYSCPSGCGQAVQNAWTAAGVPGWLRPGDWWYVLSYFWIIKELLPFVGTYFEAITMY